MMAVLRHLRELNTINIRPSIINLVNRIEFKSETNFDVNDVQRRYLSSSHDDYQYIQRSSTPTLHFQPSLPRLPIPDLEKTCERYLSSLALLVSQEQLNKTKQIVANFRAEEGKALHEELKARDKKNKHTSYISGPWFDMYLRARDPIVLNFNPFMSFVDDPKPEYNDQLIRSTNMLISALRFLKSLRAGILEPEVYHLNPSKSDNEKFRKFTRRLPSIVSWYGAYFFKAFPLDMSQYNNLFNATRIPEKDKDRLFKDESAKHILVIKNGNFFTFDVLDKNGNILDAGHIYKCMKYIVEDVKDTTPEFAVSYLTGENRNTWANAREQLVQSGNFSALNRIDSALFALILDDTKPGSDPVNLFRNMLYGDGSNRWFDKCFQLIVAKDGKAAINFEHSWGDGVAVLRFFNEIFKDSTQKPRITPNFISHANVDPSQAVTKIEFKLDDKCKRFITDAKNKYTATTTNLAVDVIQFPKLGKNFLKQKKISPDAVMQLAFQMAFYRQTGRTVASYESCSTAAFRHGRTETIRPATAATKESSIAFSKTPLPSASELRPLLDKCSKLHSDLTRNAAMGQGFDRHLFALKHLAAEKNMKMPSIFNDSSYQLINHIILSTSTLSSPAAAVGGFGPVVKDGLGIGYLINDDMAASVVTSYPPDRDGADYVKCLESSFNDIHTVLNN